MLLIDKRLRELADPAYSEFQSKLVPNLPPETILGVRLPVLRKFAKEISNEQADEFMSELPHRFYDKNMLHGILLSGVRDYGTCIEGVERFLPYVDNWAVCDTMSPKCFSKHRAELLAPIRLWLGSSETYTVRFGIGMLMRHYLDKDFRPEYLEAVSSIHSDEYYVNMMIAWYFATALSKQWDAAVGYIENRRLDRWTHNKAIQKAKESYRITEEQKRFLNTFKF